MTRHFGLVHTSFSHVDLITEGQMNDSKPWWTSMGIWGSLAVILGIVLPNLGVNVDPTDLSKLASGWGQFLDTAAVFFGSAAALYGRARATKQVTLTRK
jgi:hypothetical protein